MLVPPSRPRHRALWLLVGSVIGLVGAFVIRSASIRQGGIIKMLSVVLAIAMDPTARTSQAAKDSGDHEIARDQGAIRSLSAAPEMSGIETLYL